MMPCFEKKSTKTALCNIAVTTKNYAFARAFICVEFAGLSPSGTVVLRPGFFAAPAMAQKFFSALAKKIRLIRSYKENFIFA
jgi:hypothetical protein